MNISRFLSIITLAVALAGCAGTKAPATEVKVATMSMQDAMDKSVAGAAIADSPVQAAKFDEVKIIQPVVTADRPVPVITQPDIRIAYIYPWVDRDGSAHFPSWTAIVVRDHQWVIPGLGAIPMDGRASQVPPNPSRNQSSR